MIINWQLLYNYLFIHGLSAKEINQNQSGKVTGAWKALATEAFHNKDTFPDVSSKKNILEISTIVTLLKQLTTAATECAQAYKNRLTADGFEHEALHTVLLSSTGQPLELNELDSWLYEDSNKGYQ
jgi:hypothetical protein